MIDGVDNYCYNDKYITTYISKSTKLACKHLKFAQSYMLNIFQLKKKYLY